MPYNDVTRCSQSCQRANLKVPIIKVAEDVPLLQEGTGRQIVNNDIALNRRRKKPPILVLYQRTAVHFVVRVKSVCLNDLRLGRLDNVD